MLQQQLLAWTLSFEHITFRSDHPRTRDLHITPTPRQGSPQRLQAWPQGRKLQAVATPGGATGLEEPSKHPSSFDVLSVNVQHELCINALHGLVITAHRNIQRCVLLEIF